MSLVDGTYRWKPGGGDVATAEIESTSEVLSRYGINPDRGFLPDPDPPRRLPTEFDLWDEIGRELPKLLAAGQVRRVMRELPVLDAVSLMTERDASRAMLLLSYFGHAYVWGEREPAHSIPPGVAVPWYQIAGMLKRPPILSYASQALYNWRRIEPEGPIALGNLAMLQNFYGGLDEEWFAHVHISIEAKSGPAMAAIVDAQQAVIEDDAGRVETCLSRIHDVLTDINAILQRMLEGCDPYIYYNRVRTFFFGWKDNPTLPQGLIYEGVADYGGRPQRIRGETGAQSSVIHAIDAALGIDFAHDTLGQYLRDLYNYMPEGHRRFLRDVELDPSIREYVLRLGPSGSALVDAYNGCIEAGEGFRRKHLEFAVRYIDAQSEKSQTNPHDIGTGGTSFTGFLRRHRDDVGRYLIPARTSSS